MNLAQKLRLIAAFARARRVRHLSRVSLDEVQRRGLRSLVQHAVRRSAFYAAHAHKPWAQWPVIGKSEWMSNFDAINTVGAPLTQVSDIALRAEHSRDFSRPWGRYSVGLSTGTSGSRGVFLVSPEERAQWAGTLMGLLLRNGLLARERIALVLRAGGSLYESLGALRLQFRFIDQSQPWERIVAALREFQPTVLVAPASALRLLCASAKDLGAARVISVAEVLDPLDRARIEQHFAVPVEQIYQATEGLLGISCEHGAVHLNEPYILVEPEWLDAERTRFIPVVTDLCRRTQPVIRYRLDDVLQIAPAPCACGRATLALAAIEGRRDDVLWLPGARATIPVFPDLLSRAIVTQLPQLEDYRVIERRTGHWSIQLRPLPPLPDQRRLVQAIEALASRLSASSPAIDIVELPRAARLGKQRRILTRERGSCAS